jgi:hypothetical protein
MAKRPQIDYKTLPERAYTARIRLLRAQRKALGKMVEDATAGVSAKATACKTLVDIDAEIICAVESRRDKGTDRVKEVERERQKLALRCAELQQRVAELEAALVHATAG